jgi:hypothetical protein
VRPQTPGKRPEKISSEIKEVKEEQKNSKAPQGLISDKDQIENKIQNTLNPQNTQNTQNTQSQGQTTKQQNQKSKEKDDDLAPTKSGSKIKMSKIGKFSDVLAGEENLKPTTKSFSVTDLESIKNYVQEISKNSNPIGKIIDFLGDDVDSMNKEMLNWIKEAKNYKDRYDEEVK